MEIKNYVLKRAKGEDHKSFWERALLNNAMTTNKKEELELLSIMTISSDEIVITYSEKKTT